MGDFARVGTVGVMVLGAHLVRQRRRHLPRDLLGRVLRGLGLATHRVRV